MQQPKLRDAKYLSNDLYPIGEIPDSIIRKIGAGIVYVLHTNRDDLSGDDWGDIFAKAVGGEHFASPVGIADVAVNKTAWSMKTVKVSSPNTATTVRLISGRCSPDFSFEISDPHENVQRTGEAILAIWNGRVDIAHAHYPKVRVGVLLRDYQLHTFVYFEEYLEHYQISDYKWVENERGNLEGYHKLTNRKCFVWQPHGSQFSIFSEVPDNSVKFKVKRPPLLTEEVALKNIQFDDSWIEIIR